MLQVEGSPEKVIEKLKRSGVPARLDCGEQSPVQFITPPSETETDEQDN
jgi:hypothetical protein